MQDRLPVKCFKEGVLVLDQVGVTTLLGVFVAGIVAWVGYVVTFWGLRRTAANGEAERRAAVDVRDPVLTIDGHSAVFDCRVVNLGKGVARDVAVECRAADEDWKALAWFAVIGVGENLTLHFDLPADTAGVVVEVVYDDGVRDISKRSTLFRRSGTGVLVRERSG